jgi:hypothetical protein
MSQEARDAREKKASHPILLQIRNTETIATSVGEVARLLILFRDYMLPAMRPAALMPTHTILIIAHDSIGLEEGPTPPPLEQLLALRKKIPGDHAPAHGARNPRSPL